MSKKRRRVQWSFFKNFHHSPQVMTISSTEHPNRPYLVSWYNNYNYWTNWPPKGIVLVIYFWWRDSERGSGHLHVSGMTPHWVLEGSTCIWRFHSGSSVKRVCGKENDSINSLPSLKLPIRLQMKVLCLIISLVSRISYLVFDRAWKTYSATALNSHRNTLSSYATALNIYWLGCNMIS